MTTRHIFPEMRIALLFRSYGPYHLARLQAARENASILALEFSNVDKEYDWNVADKKREAEVKCLGRHDGNHHRITHDLTAELLRFAPSAVAIPGYSETLCLQAACVCRKLDLPIILMSDSHALQQNRGSLREVLKQALLPIFDAALVAGTPHADYLERLGFPRDKIATGYDVVDNRHFTMNDDSGGSSARHKPPKNYFFCCSRFVEGKNIDGLIDAFHRYRCTSERTSWDLIIAGDGPLRDAIQRQIKRLSLTEYVHLLGRQTYDQLPKLYASADGFIMPSFAETWGLVVNEAMAAGLPVLVSQTAGCHTDLIKEGVNGHVFDPKNTHQLAMLLAKLAASPQRKDMGVASRRIIRDWDLHRFASGLAEAAHIACASRASKRSPLAAVLAKTLSYKN